MGLKGSIAAGLLLAVLLAAADPVEPVRTAIVAAYQHSLDALSRGDADSALEIDTPDWISVVAGQPPRTKRELEPYIRRDIASLKPPPGWSATWRPDYDRNGTTSGIQVYDVRLDGDAAIVLCLVGATRSETVGGVTHAVWTGSHVRDTWIRTPAGWRRSKHEKLTINERLIDGRPVRP